MTKMIELRILNLPKLASISDQYFSFEKEAQPTMLGQLL